ncbi:methyl-accepting chemotaxis protein [Bacillus piscicola]|uniref:methyl-accepting chemotaxis protein n=1 Tax=Bacillus piscicola TaxID=1632684 RepID=UPI003B837025
MGDLSAGAEEQAGASSEISSFVRDLNKQIHVTNEDSETLAHSSRDVFNMSREGMEQMEVSVQQMNDITALVTDTADKVQGLDRRSAEISKLVEVIEGIADQTNLLALNAAIEAARAGEAGRGFSVVAEEVKKLAEQVGYSVSDITSIIEGIQEETKTVVHSLQKGHEKTEAGNEQITTSLEYFTSINDSISDMRGRIQNIATSLTDIASNSEKVTQSADEISANSEETAAGIEQSSATAQQQSSSMQEVAGSAETLSRLAVDLNDLVRTFRLS